MLFGIHEYPLISLSVLQTKCAHISLKSTNTSLAFRLYKYNYFKKCSTYENIITIVKHFICTLVDN